jgi:hypothetical protein
MKRVLQLMAMMYFIVFVACKKPYTNNTIVQIDCSSTDSRYAAKIFPLIQASCATNITCHGAGSNNGPGALQNYSQIHSASEAIKNAVSSGLMPKNSSLATTEKNSIICWVSSGAPDN